MTPPKHRSGPSPDKVIAALVEHALQHYLPRLLVRDAQLRAEPAEPPVVNAPGTRREP